MLDLPPGERDIWIYDARCITGVGMYSDDNEHRWCLDSEMARPRSISLVTGLRKAGEEEELAHEECRDPPD